MRPDELERRFGEHEYVEQLGAGSTEGVQALL
jgi:hypothetical protein